MNTLMNRRMPSSADCCMHDGAGGRSCGPALPPRGFLVTRPPEPDPESRHPIAQMMEHSESTPYNSASLED